ncbi:MAG: thioredoxin family protein [Pseudolabrys sp.]|nr:thioredoxin family protein [Pseudolabrys sp.]MDP2297882.1 thioredoxin family protein [Pseudolabrys sp.]
MDCLESKSLAQIEADARAARGANPYRWSLSTTRRSFMIGGFLATASVGFAHRALADPVIVANLAQYKSGLSRLSERYEVALVDIGAEWCPFCQTIDNKILPDPQVRQAMARVGLVKVDVTRMDEASRELLAHLRADGPPTLFVVQTASGREYAGTRSLGSFRAIDLIRRLRPFV